VPNRRPILTLTLLLLLSALPTAAARSLPNFNLLDVRETNHELYRAPGRAVVLFFTGTGCPIARKCSPKLRALQNTFQSQGVHFWIINSYPEESPRDIRKEIMELGLRTMTYLLDSNQAVAMAYRVDRTAEVIAINTQTWEPFYRGAIDEQFAEGSEKPTTGTEYLKDALDAFLNNQPIPTERTRPRGCRITYARSDDPDKTPDYATEVAPILRNKCAECHQPDGVGPWSMNAHRRVANYADMIEEVLTARRMPPWDPNPAYGSFQDEQRLSRDEVQTLIRWVQAGAPKGEGPDPLTEPMPPLPTWQLGSPDAILTIPEPQRIPASGVLDYRYVTVDNPFTEDVWLSGMEIKPGNAKVVHHVILYVDRPGYNDPGNGAFFIGWAPGASALHYPAGTAKRLPKGSRLTLELHYTTCGSEQEDTTQVALFRANGPQTSEAETRFAIEWNLNIQPGDDEARHSATYAFTQDTTLYGFFPHMHYRGKWMRYELLTPNGKKTTLLHVPRYDFLWQFSYYPTQPIQVPAGSWLLVTGAFDNSANNPANPDPTKQVHFNQQSWDEMFIGFFEAAH
jgi:peroxiredoxin/mono/diheme cytochrome c family protein